MSVAAPTLTAASPSHSVWPRVRLPGTWSLARQYLIASLLVVLGGVLVTGAWIGHQIETSVLDRTAGITALYVDSVVSPKLQNLAQEGGELTPGDTAALNTLINTTGLGQDVVQF